MNDHLGRGVGAGVRVGGDAGVSPIVILSDALEVQHGEELVHQLRLDVQEPRL